MVVNTKVHLKVNENFMAFDLKRLYLQQNGVAERMNITIDERIRCMLSHFKLLKSLWGEAMRTSIDLINLSSLFPLKLVYLKRCFI